MLTELVVEDLGVIDRAEVAFEAGSSAITGETGAGKTLVVAALSLLLGERAERALVRSGASRAMVQGRFEVPPNHPVVGGLRARGLLDEVEPGAPGGARDEPPMELIVARTVPADGRSSGKARVNGHLVSASVLSEVMGELVEIAGQRGYQRASSPAFHRAVLDNVAGAEATELLHEVAASMQEAGRSARIAAELATGERERRREVDLLDYEIKEIRAAHIEAGEIARLKEDAVRLENAESLAAGLEEAAGLLRDERGAEESVVEAARALERLERLDPRLGELAGRLRAAAVEIQDVAHEVAASVVAPDPQALADVQARLDLMSRLAKKYGETEEEILNYLARAEIRRAELEGADDSLARAQTEHEKHHAQATALARRLSGLRRAAAPRLEAEAARLLGELALPEAQVRVSIESRDLYEGGSETVQLLVSTNPGEEPRPVAKVASGGELSRLALALHLLAATRGVATTMVFDEVDAGVGGAAAQSVGRALAQLAEKSGAQVIVVTHLPQVAAFADTHFLVDKEVRDGRTEARVTRVSGQDRIAELSRMLAGMPASERAREHAQELLELAGRGTID